MSRQYTLPHKEETDCIWFLSPKKDLPLCVTSSGQLMSLILEDEDESEYVLQKMLEDGVRVLTEDEVYALSTMLIEVVQIGLMFQIREKPLTEAIENNAILQDLVGKLLE